ncbi:MAG: iron-sulfur cluster repair di-iron protein [Bacteroidota bacterium]
MEMIQTIDTDISIGKIVTMNFRTAEVFKKYGIDFCCKGNRLLIDVCKEKNLDYIAIENEVLQAMEPGQSISENDYRSMPLDELIVHIQNYHHNYVRQSIPVLMAYLDKVNKVHGERHPELNEIFESFKACGIELTHHMLKEENILFPAIKNMVQLSADGKPIQPFFFGALNSPISMMQDEHTVEGNRLQRIAELTNNYTPPEDACTTYKVSFQKLKEFQDDLFLHIHLENNILFPNAMEMEKTANFA